MKKCVQHEDGSLQVLFQSDSSRYSGDHIVVAGGVGSEDILRNSGIHIAGLKTVWGQSLFAEGFPYADGIAFFGKQSAVSYGGKFWFGSYDYSHYPSQEEQCLGNNQMTERLSYLGLLCQNVEYLTRLGGRLRTADRAPLIGPVKLPGTDRYIHLNTGHYKSAIPLAYPSAKIIASYLSGDSLGIKFRKSFLPIRFLSSSQ